MLGKSYQNVFFRWLQRQNPSIATTVLSPEPLPNPPESVPEGAQRGPPSPGQTLFHQPLKPLPQKQWSPMHPRAHGLRWCNGVGTLSTDTDKCTKCTCECTGKGLPAKKPPPPALVPVHGHGHVMRTPCPRYTAYMSRWLFSDKLFGTSSGNAPPPLNQCGPCGAGQRVRYYGCVDHFTKPCIKYYRGVHSRRDHAFNITRVWAALHSKLTRAAV